MNFLLDILSYGVTATARAIREMASHLPLTSVTPSNCSERKRKFDMAMVSPDESKKGIFPVFSPTSSPSKSKSPSITPPSRKRSNLTLRQGANQNNKILRYLQPKRLLGSFNNNPVSSGMIHSHSPPPPSSSYEKSEDKENKILDVRVSLVRLEDDDTYSEHSYCVSHLSPKKYCCNAASEYVVQELDSIISDDIRSPCRRLGLPTPVCVAASGCHHSETVGTSSSYQDTLLSTMVNADLQVMMIRACCQDLCAESYPSPSIIHAIFSIMKESADQKTIALGRSYLKRALDFHPPCTSTMRKYYISILHSLDFKVSIPSGLWSLKTFDFFQKVLTEVEDHIEGMLNPSQLKEKLKTPGIRKIVKPKRFRDSPSPDKRPRLVGRGKHRVSEPTFEEEKCDLNCLSDEALRKRQVAEEAVKALSDNDKTDHIFARFEILVDILEWDLIVWLSRNTNYSKIRDREVCPLVVMALWRPEADTGYDSVHCRRVFSIYASAWILKFHPRHIRTLARLNGLIAEVISASEPNPGNVYPYVGEGCENLGRKLSDVMKNIQQRDLKNKAVAMIKPDWLKMLVSANLLGITPSISAVVRDKA